MTFFLPAEILLNEAKIVASYAYAPYLPFPVGAACQLADGTIICGTNVQYASTPISVCAENAMLSAYVASGKYPMPIVAVAIWAEKTPNHYITPCGSCRQALAEFLKPESPIYVAHPNQPHTVRTFTMRELLPHQFTLDAV
jgi:cytidine deaminase